jgi:hypothetical protein
MFLVLVIRQLLITENKRRDAVPVQDDVYDDVYVERLASDGSGRMEKVKVDKVRCISLFRLCSDWVD